MNAVTPTASLCRPTANLFSGKPNGNDAGIALAMAVAISLIFSFALIPKPRHAELQMRFCCGDASYQSCICSGKSPASTFEAGEP